MHIYAMHNANLDFEKILSMSLEKMLSKKGPKLPEKLSIYEKLIL